MITPDSPADSGAQAQRRTLPPELSPRAGVRRSRTRRVLKITAFSLAGLVLVVAAGGYGLLRYYESNLTRVHLAAPVGASGNAENFLLVGSDTRTGVGKGFGSSSAISGARSDTVILAHLPADGAKPVLVSFPRDSYVQIPAYTDASGVAHPAQMNKLNAAYDDGGPQLLVDTIEHLTGLRVDHYVEVNFAGFERMVNAVGGVTLCARTSRDDPANGVNGGSNDFMTAGLHTNVDGAVALAFVRDRHSFANEDISRIQDQQYFLAQLMKKVLSTGVLLNPIKITGFLNAATQSLTVDQRLSFGDLYTLATRLRHLDPSHVTFVTIPFATSNGTADIGGVPASVVLLDHTRDHRLFAQLSGAAGSSSTSGSTATYHVKRHAIRGGQSASSLTCGA